MDFTYTLSVNHNLSPFAIMDQDKDRVIMLINYFIEKSDKIDYEKPVEQKPRQIKNDGFWDF